MIISLKFYFKIIKWFYGWCSLRRKDIEYKDYDYSKSKNLDNVDENDLIYLEEQLGNSEGMNELYKQIQIMMFGGSM